MKRNLLLLLLLIIGSSTSGFAQKEKKKKEDPKHTNHFKAVTKDNGDVTIDIENAVAKTEYAKFKLRITNKTNDYIIYKPQESTFKFESTKVVPEDKKEITINPLDKETKVIDAKGSNLHVESFRFLVEGLYKVSPKTTSEKVPAFKLPASVNEVSGGNFKIEMVQNKKETQETVVKFRVTYSGDGYGLVEAKKLGVKTEGGEEFANDKNNQKPFLLKKGESDTFIALFHIPAKTADMQFANLEIIWRDAFKECTVKKVESLEVDLTVDEGLTEAKNK